MSSGDRLPTKEPASTVWKPGKHLLELDGVRGLAILIVSLYRFSREIPTDTMLGKAFAVGFRFGDRGVDLFFVLSGFLITGVLLQSRGQPSYFRNFFARRTLRIFPLYYASLAVLIFLAPLLPSAQGAFNKAIANQLYLWTYLTNYKMAWEGDWCFGVLDHFWSLAVEEHFYFVWPIVIFAVTTRRLLPVALGLAGVCAAARIGFAITSENGVASDVLSMFRFDALLLGGGVALAIRRHPNSSAFCWFGWGLAAVCGCIGCGLAVLHVRAFTVTHSLFALLWSGMLIALLSGSSGSLLARFFRLSVLRWLGKYSYAMYVFQSPLIPLAAPIVSVAVIQSYCGSQVVAAGLYIPLMLLLTCGAALVSWHGLEKHMLRLKRWFPTTPDSRP